MKSDNDETLRLELEEEEEVDEDDEEADRTPMAALEVDEDDDDEEEVALESDLEGRDLEDETCCWISPESSSSSLESASLVSPARLSCRSADLRR